jgi:predicted CopG family antitoxin
MSRLINVSDAVYEELTLLKRAREASYSETIVYLLESKSALKKRHTWREMVDWMKKRDATFKGKKEKTDIDLIAHGVSRDDS